MNQTTNTTARIDLDAAQLDKLEALARAATPGPWSYEAEDNMISYDGYKLVAWQPRSNTVGIPQRCANGEFIAAANPATVLQLIKLARRSTSGSDGTAAADELYGYVLKTGHGNKFIETLVNVHPEVRHMWKPVYVKVAAPAPAAQDERDVKDAARYRWLRDVCPEFEAMASPWLYDDLDKAIDAAMSQSQGQQSGGSDQ